MGKCKDVTDWQKVQSCLAAPMAIRRVKLMDLLVFRRALFNVSTKTGVIHVAIKQDMMDRRRVSRLVNQSIIQNRQEFMLSVNEGPSQCYRENIATGSAFYEHLE